MNNYGSFPFYLRKETVDPVCVYSFPLGNNSINKNINNYWKRATLKTKE